MNITEYLTPIVAFAGVLLSLLSIIYTKQQNTRKLKVDINFNDSKFRFMEDPTDITIELSAFNSGFRSVAILGYEFLVNDRILEFSINDSYPKPTEKNKYIFIYPDTNNKLPYSLKEGEINTISITAVELARVIKNKRFDKKKFEGKVMISGYYKTAHDKIYKSSKIEFNLDEWEGLPLPDE